LKQVIINYNSYVFYLVDFFTNRIPYLPCLKIVDDGEEEAEEEEEEENDSNESEGIFPTDVTTLM